MPIVHPSQTFLQTWKVVSYWQQQYHPGYIPRQWKSSYVTKRNYNDTQQDVGKYITVLWGIFCEEGMGQRGALS